MQDTNIVLTDFAVASVIVEASLLAVLSYASIYALMRKRSSLSTGRFLWVFGISSAIFGVGYLLEPAVDYVLSPDESYGPVFFLEFYPGFAIAKGLIWATGGLLPGLLFTIALFFTRASASPLLAAIFATAALAATDLFSLVVCSLLCRSHEIASARDSIIFSLASDVVGGPIGGLIGFWFFRRVRDGNVTLAEESTRVLLGAFIGLVILCGAYILFAYPLPSRMALVISDHSAATLKRSASPKRNLQNEDPKHQKIASSYVFGSATKDLHFYRMLAAYPISLTVGENGPITVKAAGFAYCRTKEEVAKLITKKNAGLEYVLGPGDQVEFRGSHQAFDMFPRNSNARSSVRVSDGAVFDFHSSQEDGKRLRSFFFREDADVEIPVAVGDTILVGALPEWFEFSDREGKLPKHTSQIANPGIVFRTSHKSSALYLPLLPRGDKCQRVEFANPRSQDRSVTERDLLTGYTTAVEIVAADSGATLTLGVQLGWLTVPWMRDQLANPDRNEEVDFLFAIAQEGSLSIGTDRIPLTREDHIMVAGDPTSLSESEEGGIHVTGTTKYITLNGQRLTPSLWSQADTEFRSLIIAAFVAAAGWFWRTQIMHIVRAMFGRS